eukprot:gene11486-8173_t
MIFGFIGDIRSLTVQGDAVGATWAILPGSSEWIVQQGSNSGESQTCEVSGYTGEAVVNQPINVIFQTQELEGWPQLLIEVWDKSDEGVKGLLGCGTVWVPTKPGFHEVSVSLWKPEPDGLAGWREMFVPSYYDINALRQLMLNPSMRVAMRCVSVGTATVELNVVASNFDGPGVSLGSLESSSSSS